MKRIKIPTVTLAISAYNEEMNIKSFLQSILRQKEESFILERILIISDGSTDKTVEKIKEIKSNKITLFDDKRRLGKSARLKYIYQSLTSDILVQSDADVIFEHKFVMRDLIKPFFISNLVVMSCGNAIPIKGKTFIQKAVNYTWIANSILRDKKGKINNVFAVDGKIMAFKRSFISGIKLPQKVIGNDRYIYYYCLSKKLDAYFVSSAKVLYSSPKTLSDHIKQNTRFFAIPFVMKKYFSENLVNNSEKIPFILITKSKLKQFLKHPIACTYIYFVNLYCLKLAKKRSHLMTSKWEVAFSTKSNIAIT